MSMNLSWIDDFFALAATGNFSRAAEDRHMTQPAFSRRIRALEEWLGAELFDRSSQPARLTEVGEWFRTVGQDLQARVAGIPGDARAIAEATSTTLRFAATHALSFTFMPRWLHTLEAHSAMGQLQLMSDTQEKCATLLAQNQVQFMLTHGYRGIAGPLDESAFEHLVVGADELIPVCAPDVAGRPLYDLALQRTGAPTQWLGYSAESGLGRILRELKGPALSRLQLHQVLTAHLASVLRTMALDKRGLAWLPKVLIGDDIAAGRLVVGASDEWRIDLEVRLYRRRGKANKAAEAFWAAAMAAAQHGGRGSA